MVFDAGRLVLYRNCPGGRVVNVRPCRVVSDDARGLLLWLPQGSQIAIETARDGRGVRSMPFAEWVRLAPRLVPDGWRGRAMRNFLPPEADHSVWFFRDTADRF